MVEDVFALAVALQIEGHAAEDAARVVVQGEVTRPPTLMRRGAARSLAGVEEVVADERVAGGGGAGVPGLATDGREAVMDLKRELRLWAHRTSTTASTSTAKPRGS